MIVLQKGFIKKKYIADIRLEATPTAILNDTATAKSWYR